MKTNSTSTYTTHDKNAGVFMLFTIACFFSFNLQAQGDRHGGGNRSPQREQSGRQPNIQRQPSIHQQSPNINHAPTQVRTPGNPNVNPVRTVPRINNGNNAFNRPQNNYNRTRPATELNRSDNNNRHDNAVYNRPGYNSNRPGYGYPGNNSNNVNNRYPGNRDYNRYNNNNNYRRPAYNSGNPNWRYAYAPRRNSVYYNLPSSYFSINFGGFGYRYYDGIYYRPYGNIFRVVAPPIGIYINTLPFGYSRLYVNDYPYYYYNGTYYDYRDNNYTVVSPPVGAVVESLPDGYETVTVDGQTYYTVEGAQYKPVTQDNGEIWYEVIKAN